MTYSIGEFSKIVGLSEHTLRFYEREGLIKVNRDDNNVRIYSDENKLWVESLLHLKNTGMSLKDMKQFFLWGSMGDETVEKRLALLKDHRKKVVEEFNKIRQSLEFIDNKINFYENKYRK
ncbi:MerR family transcriptional regulator [Bacillus spizizenii]|uniref:MerR family transcriptional regulator n=1 Tax=Bacillus spizizenii TaxID=96241 RepID=UPI0005CA6EFF|nr:MerR family transcriptional regulator [Bacillus spizizenii]MCY7834351.1 MerR family transcriptional regulator [Bacillus spizizenii]MCY7973372.1 MerR family transcriptional regulator [Bacillus spizizenii]MCY8058037.1 MerR family transcriptional regulator [Bacillus spizizenii]MCY8109626.1 MerR family transcriptional regulator [Bacillus spizizenii]MCY8253498.1 MerR family transcriptional regulator [Bacillus spizizenii]